MKKKRKHIPSTASVTLFFTCIIPGIVVMHMQNKENARCSEAVSAVVVDYSEGSKQVEDDDGNVETVTIYRPVLSYTYDNKEYTEASPKAQDFKKYDLQEVIDISLNPEDPADYVIQDESDRVIKIGKILIKVGVTVLILGIIF